MPKSKNLKQLRSFLGWADYCKKIVKNYVVLAYPLTRLLGKDQFKWTMKTEEAFNFLKSALITLLILAFPNFSISFILETGASALAMERCYFKRTDH